MAADCRRPRISGRHRRKRWVLTLLALLLFFMLYTSFRFSSLYEAHTATALVPHSPTRVENTTSPSQPFESTVAKAVQTEQERPHKAEVIVERSRVRILFFTRHDGTIGDFHAAMGHFNLNFTAFKFDDDLWGYGMNRQTAVKSSNLAKLLCQAYDVIVVADTTPDGRPFMVSLDDQKCAKTKIVFQVTNRFDWDIKDRGEYLEDVRGTFRHPNVFWIANNQFEPRYMASKGLTPPEFPIIRPVGQPPTIPTTPTTTTTPPTARVAFILAPYNHLTRSEGVPTILRQLGVAFVALQPKYGGPSALTQYDAVIMIPYQVSVMKFFENLAAGVIMYFPSPKFSYQLAMESHRSSSYLFPPTSLCRQDFDQCLDYYQPEFLKWIYTFDSYQNLKELLEKPDLDPRKLRGAMPAWWQEYLSSVTWPGWRNLLTMCGALDAGT